MRSFTKKNIPLNNRLSRSMLALLGIKPEATIAVTNLLNALKGHEFSKASKELINLIDNQQVNDFIDADRENIKEAFAVLKDVELGTNAKAVNFDTYFTSENFPKVIIAHIDNAMNALHPSPAEVLAALNGKNDKNNLNIAELVKGNNEQEKTNTLTQIGRLIVLKQLLRFAEIRSHYRDAEYRIDHYPIENGDEYQISKLHLIHATVLFVNHI